jgi:hypothetical protein
VDLPMLTQSHLDEQYAARAQVSCSVPHHALMDADAVGPGRKSLRGLELQQHCAVIGEPLL